MADIASTDLLVAARAGEAHSTGSSARSAPSWKPTATAWLGSVHDAQDLVHETLLRAWRGLDRSDVRGQRADPSAALPDATNRCPMLLGRRELLTDMAANGSCPAGAVS